MGFKFAISYLICSVIGTAIYGQEFPVRVKTRGRHHPIFIFKEGAEQLTTDTAVNNDELIKHIDPRWIDSVKVIKGSEGKAAYMESANDGAIFIFLNEKHYPNALKVIDIYLQQHKK